MTGVLNEELSYRADWDTAKMRYQDALGEETRGRLRDFSRVAVKSSETKLFQFSPRMSYLSKEMADRSPEFWNPKPPSAPVKRDEKK